MGLIQAGIPGITIKAQGVIGIQMELLVLGKVLHGTVINNKKPRKGFFYVSI